MLIRAPHPTRARAPFLTSFAALTLLSALAACGESDPVQPEASAGNASGGAGASGAAGSSSSGAAGLSGGGTGGSAGAAVGGSAGVGGGAGGVSGAGGAGGAGNGGTSGSAGSGGSAGAAGGPAYNPCPTNGDACRIMPLGDSITDGCCGENTKSMGGSYRVELFHLSLQNDKKLTFVGSHTSGPNMVDNVQFPKNQEGHSGWTIADGGGRDGLQDQIGGWLSATPADIITLMIGTNDVSIQEIRDNAPATLMVLIDTITKAAPKTLVVLAQIVPTQSDNDNKNVQAYNSKLPAIVKSFADQGKHVIMVDMYSAFTAQPDFKNTMFPKNNNLHPSDAGYAVMANTWWAAIKDVLPSK